MASKCLCLSIYYIILIYLSFLTSSQILDCLRKVTINIIKHCDALIQLCPRSVMICDALIDIIERSTNYTFNIS